MVVTGVNRSKSLDLITEHLRELSSLTITIPLNSPICKKIHTNMMIRTKLKTPELINMKEIGEIVRQTAQTRNSAFTQNVWYIEKTEIDITPKAQTMKITLNPFPQGLGSYTESLRNLRNTENQTSSANTKKTPVKTKTKEFKLHKVSGQSKSDQAYLESIVKKAIGTAKTDLARAKAIHEYYKNNHRYHLYYDFTYSSFKSLWNKKNQNCGDGARTLKLMFKCIGLDAKVRLGSASQIGQRWGHYWVQVSIDGKMYYCDNAGCEGCRSSRNLGTGSSSVWGGHVTAGRIVE